MRNATNRKKRSKLTVALLAPILAIVFIIGWSLSWIGQSGQLNTKQPIKPMSKMPAKQDEVELIVISPQEKEIVAN